MRTTYSSSDVVVSTASKIFLVQMGTHFSHVSGPHYSTGSHVQCWALANIHTYLHSKKHVCTYNTNPCFSALKFNSEVVFSGKTQHTLCTAKIQPPWRQLSLLGPALDCDFVGRQLNCRAELKVFLITDYFHWLLTLFQTPTWEPLTDQLSSCVTRPRSSNGD